MLPEGFEDDSLSPSSKKPEREGLPTGYRMRADAHYVELLSSKRDRSESRGSKRDREAMIPTLVTYDLVAVAWSCCLVITPGHVGYPALVGFAQDLVSAVR